LELSKSFYKHLLQPIATHKHEKATKASAEEGERSLPVHELKALA